jgi:ribosome-binding protein aMBF1 (putative translation factor)
MNLMQTQDWTPVFIKSSNPSKVIPMKKEIVERKQQTTNIKLDSNDEITKIKYVPKEISQQIISARIVKKWTRKELAQKLNMKEDIIASIELGKAIYDGAQIARIKKSMGI